VALREALRESRSRVFNRRYFLLVAEALKKAVHCFPKYSREIFGVTERLISVSGFSGAL